MLAGAVQAGVYREDISRPVEWNICRDRHVLVAHIGGRMEQLETELNGRCTSVGPAVAGEIWLIPAGTHYIGRAKGGSIRFAEVELDESVLPHFSERHLIAGRPDPVATRLAVNAAYGDEEAALGLAQHIDRYFVELGDPESSPIPPARLKRVLSAINTRLDEGLVVRDLAALAGYSVNGFIRAFTTTMSATPAQYLIRQRLRRAQWLLENSELDIAAIAYHTGFSSHAHLTSTFASKLGTSPSRWRLAAKGEYCGQKFITRTIR